MSSHGTGFVSHGITGSTFGVLLEEFVVPRDGAVSQGTSGSAKAAVF